MESYVQRTIISGVYIYLIHNSRFKCCHNKLRISANPGINRISCKCFLISSIYAYIYMTGCYCFTGDRCYKLYNELQSWYEAVTACRSLGQGYTLASITSESEQCKCQHNFVVFVV